MMNSIGIASKLRHTFVLLDHGSVLRRFGWRLDITHEFIGTLMISRGLIGYWSLCFTCYRSYLLNLSSAIIQCHELSVWSSYSLHRLLLIHIHWFLYHFLPSLHRSTWFPIIIALFSYSHCLTFFALYFLLCIIILIYPLWLYVFLLYYPFFKLQCLLNCRCFYCYIWRFVRVMMIIHIKEAFIITKEVNSAP